MLKLSKIKYYRRFKMVKKKLTSITECVDEVFDQAVEQDKLSKEEMDKVMKERSKDAVQEEPKAPKTNEMGLVEQLLSGEGFELSEGVYSKDFKDRKSMSAVIGKLKENKIGFNVSRSSQEGMRYTLKALKEEVKRDKNKYEKLFDEMLEYMEFRLVKYPDGTFGLIDLQGGNLGNIEDDRFDNALQLLDRLDIYYEDYFIRDLEEQLEEVGVDTSDLDTFEDFLQYRDKLPEAQWDFDVLDMVINHPNDIDLNNCYREDDHDDEGRDDPMTGDDVWESLNESFTEEIKKPTEDDIKWLKNWLNLSKESYMKGWEDGHAYIVFDAKTKLDDEGFQPDCTLGIVNALLSKGFKYKLEQGDYTYKTVGTFNPRSMQAHNRGLDRTLKNRVRLDIYWGDNEDAPQPTDESLKGDEDMNKVKKSLDEAKTPERDSAIVTVKGVINSNADVDIDADTITMTGNDLDHAAEEIVDALLPKDPASIDESCDDKKSLKETEETPMYIKYWMSEVDNVLEQILDSDEDRAKFGINKLKTQEDMDLMKSTVAKEICEDDYVWEIINDRLIDLIEEYCYYLDESLKEDKTSLRDRVDAKRDDRVEGAKAEFDKVRDDADAQRDDRFKKHGLKENVNVDMEALEAYANMEEGENITVTCDLLNVLNQCLDALKGKDDINEASTAFKRAVNNGGDDLQDYLDGKAITKVKDPNEKSRLIAMKKLEKGGKLGDRPTIAQELKRKEGQAEADYEKKATKYVAKADVQEEKESNEGAPMNEDLKLICELGDYRPWSGAVDFYNELRDAGLLDELEFILEDIYPDGMTMTELNDLLWFEEDWVREMLGISKNDSEDDTEDIDERFLA